MVGAIQSPSVQISPRIGGTVVSARVPENHRDESAKRPAPETTGNATVKVPAAGPGGASAFEAQVVAQVAAQARGNKDDPPEQLSEEERRVVRKLQARDREVRAHESAHQAAGGGLTGAASFTFEQGPDGRRYAVGGEVPIDASPVAGDPDATIAKLRTVKRAALAPAEPSATDRSIASSAESGIRHAQVEKQSQVAEERSAKAAENDQGESMENRPPGSTLSVLA